MPLSCVQKSRSYWRRTRYSRPLQPRWSQGSTKAPTSSFPRNTVGYIQSGTCVFWNRALVKLPFKMLTQRRLFQCVRPFDWVAAIDLKDAYFHVSILPRFRFAYKGASIPVGPPLRAPQPVGASGQPGKEQTLPYAEDLFSRQGVGLGQPHSTSLRGAVLSQCWDAWSLSSARGRFPLKHFQRLLGHMASSAAITPLGLLIWDRFSVGFTTESRDGHGTTAHTGSHSPRPAVAPSAHGRILLSSGRSSPRASIQARCCFNRRLCHGLGGHVQRARSRGALDRAPAAVAYQLPRVAGSMACSAPLQNAATREAYTGPSDNTATVAYINHQAVYAPVACRNSPAISSFGVRSIWGRFAPFMSQASSIVQPTSSHVSTPFRENGDSTPRYPAELETLRGRSGRPVCLPGHVSLPVVFLPVRGDPRYRCTGMQLASGLTQICVSPSEPSRTDPVQGQGGRGASPLGAPYWPNRTWFQNWCSSRQPLLGKFLWGGIYFLREGAPSGTRAQTCGISTYGPWTGRGGSKWATSSGSKHYHFCQGLSTRQATGWSGTCSSIGVLPAGRTPVDARSQSCFLSCRMGWSEGCLPPPSKCMLPLLPHITMQ